MSYESWIKALTDDTSPRMRMSIALVSLLFAAVLSVTACFLKPRVLVLLSFAAGIPFFLLGCSLLLGDDRDGKRGMLVSFGLYAAAAAIMAGSAIATYEGA